MSKFSWCFVAVGLSIFLSLTGCGGRSGGELEMPPVSENPYQITAEQQEAMDQSLGNAAKAPTPQ